MISNERGHYGIERVYSDPSAAHERGMIFKRRGSYRVVIEPVCGSYFLIAWFKTVEQALAAL